MDECDALRLQAVDRRLRLFRWWLIGGLAAAILSAPALLAIQLSLAPLFAVLVLLGLFNWLSARRGVASPGTLARQLAIDIIALGVLLYLTGGVTNPLVSLLLLPVAIAAFVLPLSWSASVAALAVGLYSLLLVDFVPLPVTDVDRAMRLHLGGMWLTFVVSVALLVWFMTRMMATLRQREEELAAARELSLRDAQVLALGQLAAGAAHELGTPLATMNVLAGELVADPRLPEQARADLDLLRRQIGLCKEIVSGLTQKAGIERAAVRMASQAWLEQLLARWRTLWPQATCAFDVIGRGSPPSVVPDVSIEQAVMNLLNNAARQPPHRLQVILDWDNLFLRIHVHDRCGGFPAEVLLVAGAEPLQTTTGNGLGLWLARAAIERRGGRLSLENIDEGGVASVTLPLQEGT